MGDVYRTKMDGVTQPQFYGAQDWTKASVVVGAGLHTYQWHCSKGDGGALNDGDVWIDRVEWAGPENSQDLQLALDADEHDRQIRR